MAGPDRHVLIYDGDCRICRRSVEWVRSADRGDSLEILPYQAPVIAERFPRVPRGDMEAAMQLVSPAGERWQGARAVERILQLLPRWRVLAFFFRIPGVRVVARYVYGLVARNRRRLGCGNHCAVGAGPRAPPEQGVQRGELPARDPAGLTGSAERHKVD